MCNNRVVINTDKSIAIVLQYSMEKVL